MGYRLRVFGFRWNSQVFNSLFCKLQVYSFTKMETRYAVLISFGMLSQLILRASARQSFLDFYCKGKALPPQGLGASLLPLEDCAEEAGYEVPLPPPVFLPVPQPVPVRVPVPKPQSVTIPNIIVALLPPKQKPAFAPRPIRPPPVVLPIPSPRPFLVPTSYKGECSPCC